MFIELKRSRFWIFATWLFPLIVYFGLSMSLPYIHEGRIESIQIFGVLTALGQIFVPVTIVFLVFYFPETQGGGRLTILTKERFWVAVMVIASYHIAMLVIFVVLVVLQDYTRPETYHETVEGRVDLFAKTALYFSLLLVIPVKALFVRANT